MKRADCILGAASILLGAAIFLYGRWTGLKFLIGKTPGPGFMPYVVAVGIVLCGGGILWGALQKSAARPKDEERAGEALIAGIFHKREFWNFAVVIGTSILVVAATPFLGLLTCMGIGVFLMAKLLGTPSWFISFLVGLGSTAVFWLIFDLFLKVPVPRGPFGF